MSIASFYVFLFLKKCLCMVFAHRRDSIKIAAVRSEEGEYIFIFCSGRLCGHGCTAVSECLRSPNPENKTGHSRGVVFDGRKPACILRIAVPHFPLFPFCRFSNAPAITQPMPQLQLICSNRTIVPHRDAAVFEVRHSWRAAAARFQTRRAADTGPFLP